MTDDQKIEMAKKLVSEIAPLCRGVIDVQAKVTDRKCDGVPVVVATVTHDMETHDESYMCAETASDYASMMLDEIRTTRHAELPPFVLEVEVVEKSEEYRCWQTGELEDEYDPPESHSDFIEDPPEACDTDPPECYVTHDDNQKNRTR